MLEVRTLNDKCRAPCELQLVNEKTATGRSNLMGEQVAMRIPPATWWRNEGIVCHPCVVQVNPPVVKWAKQANLDFKLAYFTPRSTRRFTNDETFKPSVVQRTVRLEVEVARI